MTSSSVLATILAAVAVLLVAGGGDACDNVPTLTWSEACLKACPTPALYNVCGETLLHAPDSAEATVYAAAAAEAAAHSYGETADRAMWLVVSGAVPDAGQRAAYERCIERYALAQGRMSSVAEEMGACDGLGRAVREYVDAALAVDACADALSPYQQSSSPLVAMNAADRDLTAVACDLGALVVGR